MSKNYRFTSLPPQKHSQTYQYPDQSDFYLKQQQEQVFSQRLTQSQAEIRYYIFQHMQYLANLLFSMEEIYNYFEDEPNHPMITIGLNKIILQMNLINTTNVDLQVRLGSQQEIKEMQECKEHAKKIIMQVTQNLNPKLKEFVGQYINNSLSNNVTIKQVNSRPSSQQYNFNQQVVQDIFNAMNKTDQEVGRLQQTKSYEIPTSSGVLQIAKYKLNYSRQYQLRTNSKLSVNFQKKISPTKSQKIKGLEQLQQQELPWDVSMKQKKQDWTRSQIQQSSQIQQKSDLISKLFLTKQQPNQQTTSAEIQNNFKLYQSQIQQKNPSFALKKNQKFY